MFVNVWILRLDRCYENLADNRFFGSKSRLSSLMVDFVKYY